MSKFSNFRHPSSSILILTIILGFCCCFTTVRSKSFIRSPTDLDTTGDECAGKSPLTNEIPPANCPVKCFRTDPVCGVDGVTYWCGCAEAVCAGTRVAKLGFCDVGSGGPAPIPGQALLLVHIVWLIVLGFSVLFGVF